MSIHCAMHSPKSAAVRQYQFNGETRAVLTFSDGAQQINIHTTPRVATAVAFAFNTAIARVALEDAA